MYTVSRSTAGVCVIINSKCCGPQIKASGFSTKKPALISPKQVSVRYRLSFTLLSSSPPLSSVPPTLPTSSADIGSSLVNPLVTEKRWGEREVEGNEAGRQKGRGEEGREERHKEAEPKLKTQSHVSLLKLLPLEHSNLKKTIVCACPDASVYSRLSIYTSIPRATDIYLCPLLHLSFFLSISLSLPHSIHCN